MIAKKKNLLSPETSLGSHLVNSLSDGLRGAEKLVQFPFRGQVGLTAAVDNVFGQFLVGRWGWVVSFKKVQEGFPRGSEFKLAAGGGQIVGQNSFYSAKLGWG